jgi:hypothetical protein
MRYDWMQSLRSRFRFDRLFDVFEAAQENCVGHAFPHAAEWPGQDRFGISGQRGRIPDAMTSAINTPELGHRIEASARPVG